MMKIKHTLLTALVFGAGFSLKVAAGEYTNFIGMKFVDIPAGEFLMGAVNCKAPEKPRKGKNTPLQPVEQQTNLGDCTSSPNYDPEAENNEAPVHKVTLRAFQMGKYEVTMKQYQTHLNVTGSYRSAAGSPTHLKCVNKDGSSYIIKDSPNRVGSIKGSDVCSYIYPAENKDSGSEPVSNLEWHHAQAFVDWLNKTKPAKDKGTYRLPSEAEWEYACKAGTNDKYCGGNDPDRVAWYGGGSKREVGKKEPNAFGLYDMSGNAIEWTADCWNNSYQGAPSTNEPWRTGECESHVQRGGYSQMSKTDYLRATARTSLRPGLGETDSGFGFRVVREVR